MALSIIILTHNCYSKKGGCIETVLLSILNQSYTQYEIIVIDNNSELENFQKLHVFTNSIKPKCDLQVIRNSQNNISIGRNIGVKKAKYETLIFLDDDTVLIDNNTLFLISELSKKSIYGYSAIRYWTKLGWYEKNKHVIDDNMVNGLRDHYGIDYSLPDPSIRDKENNRHLIRTYIGNFGFVNRNAFIEIGMWDSSYTGYGVEDDAAAFALFSAYGRPTLLTEIEVVHITHRISKANLNELSLNRQKFDYYLKSKGIKEFHVGRLLYCEPNVIEYVE